MPDPDADKSVCLLAWLAMLLIALMIVGGGYLLAYFFPGGQFVGVLPFPPFNTPP